jgi:type II secretory pathway component GspD/PulD (secretin)
MSLLFSEQPSLNTDLGPLPQGFDRIRSADNIYTISVAINYLLENGYAELMNRSSLTVANNGTGRLFVGESIPYRSTFQVSELGRVTQRIATQQVGLDLTVRPHANPDGTVTMVLQPQNSNLLELTDVGPRTVNQNFTTTIRVKDGEPFVIGGFIRDEKRVKYDRFPFLSELPLLGQLFQNKAVTNTRSELIFVFTPHIIQPTQTPPIVRTTAEMDVPIPFATAGSY